MENLEWWEQIDLVKTKDKTAATYDTNASFLKLSFLSANLRYLWKLHLHYRHYFQWFPCQWKKYVQLTWLKYNRISLAFSLPLAQYQRNRMALSCGVCKKASLSSCLISGNIECGGDPDCFLGRLKVRVHVRFCTPRLLSRFMRLTYETIHRVLERITGRCLAAQTVTWRLQALGRQPHGTKSRATGLRSSPLDKTSIILLWLTADYTTRRRGDLQSGRGWNNETNVSSTTPRLFVNFE